MNLSLSEQLIDLRLFVPERKIVRHLRKITRANTGHSYTAEIYIEYSDGVIEFQRFATLLIANTNVRLRKEGSAWEEYLVICPGWFRCEEPKK